MPQQDIEVYRKMELGEQYDTPQIMYDDIDIKQADSLKEEIRSFINAVQTRCAPAVSGEAGRDALKIALEIVHQVESQKTGAAADALKRSRHTTADNLPLRSGRFFIPAISDRCSGCLNGMTGQRLTKKNTACHRRGIGRPSWRTCGEGAAPDAARCAG